MSEIAEHKLLMDSQLVEGRNAAVGVVVLKKLASETQ